MSSLTYAFDASFTTAFGAAGKAAVQSAFATWDAAFGKTGQPSSTSSTGTGNVFDIESIALHEIGHALGLHHPNQAGTKSFDKTGANVAATGNEVMNSTIAKNEIQRALTQDDIDGFSHLYSTTNAVPTVTGNSPFSTGDTFGPGDVNFTESGTASTGGLAGANFDIFAVDLGATGPLAVVSIFGGAGSGGGLTSSGTPLGGFLNGTPFNLHSVGAGLDNANHGSNLISIDIQFNTNATNPLGIVTAVPEPSSLFLVVVGAIAFLAYSRRVQRTTAPSG